PMILSIHVAKAAGNSFRECLEATFGSRLMKDYGDWAGFDHPEAHRRRLARTAAMRDRRDELIENYDIIHGHFVADKYAGMFARPSLVAFFRDPYQQSVAHYHFLKRNPQRDHLEERIFHEAQMTLHDYLRWDAFYNHQSQYLGNVPVEDFTMVGLSSEFERSIELFKSIYDYDLGSARYANINHERAHADYPIDAETKKAVDKYRAADIELYRRATEIFSRLTAKYAA
ncbi:MAG: hypothetical protein ACREMT_08700, partial [Vulcanimicrobiaceae bacterium]